MNSSGNNIIPGLNKIIDDRTQTINILDDQPTAKAEFFNFDAYAQSITKIITNEKTGTPLVIGIFGDWGSGKTSLMRKIQTELDGKYLFGWEDIPGNDNKRLIEFLKQKFDIDWVKTAIIEKIDNGKTIRLTEGNNFLSLKLNNEQTNVKLEINDYRTDELITKIENGKLNIYDGKNSTTIWFNAWKYNTEDAIWRALLTSIIEKLKIDRKDEKSEESELNDLQNSLYYDVQREELGSLKFYPGKAITILVKSILSEVPLIRKYIEVEKNGFDELFEIFQREKKEINIKKITFIDQFLKRFERIIKNDFKERVVIFIDDLDRCNPEKAIEILEAIKLFLDVEGCIFILGIDRRVISRGIDLKYKELKGNNIDDIISGNNYLEKIIQLEFFLPKIPEDKIKEFIEINSDLSEDYFELIVKGIEGNPRKIKRLLNFIQFQLNLSRTIPEIQKEIEILKENKGARGEKTFEAMLIEWTIISSYYPDFMKEVIEENGSLLLNMHNYYAGKYEGKELDKNLKSYINNEKYEKLHALITAFSNTFMSPILYENEIKNSKSLIKKLVTQNNLSDFIFKQFSTDVQNHLSNSCMKSKIPNTEICKLLVDGLNKIIKGDYIFKDDFFTNIKISEKTKKLIESNPQGKAIFLANRLLLDEAFPDEIVNFKEFDLNISNIRLIIHLSGTVDIESIKKTSEEFKKMDGGKEESLITIGKDAVLKLIKDRKTKSLKGKSMTGMDLSNEDLSGFDLTGVKLNGAIMKKTILNNANLEGANLYSTNLQEANLEHANLRNAILTRTNLRSAILNGAILENAKLNNAELWHAKLEKADLKGANLKDAVIFNASMESADFTGANLYNAGMMSAKMEGAIFTGADLRSCNLISAKFDKKTDFRGADIDSTTINNLGGSNWDQAQWSDDVLIKIKEKYSWS